MQLGLIRQFDPHRREEYFTPLDISDERRLQHLFVIGRTGTGKSTALKNFILQDIVAGAGCAFFDPHGDDTAQLLSLIPPERQKDVILYDPSDFDFPIGFNPLNNVPIPRRPFVASAVVDCFRAIWGHSWGPKSKCSSMPASRRFSTSPMARCSGSSSCSRPGPTARAS